MSLTLPRLDDRRWTDLVEEGRALLPLYAPGWTDHNLHDPGITLLELLAWIAEQDLYRIDRVPAAHRRKFLALLGIAPRPAAGAEAALGVRLAGAGGDPLPLPAGLLLSAATAAGEPAGWLTVEPLVAVPGTLAALQVGAGGEIRDLTPAWRRGEPVAPFGDDPQAGDAFYLGFSEPPPAGEPLAVHFEVEGGGAEERRRLLERLREAECRPESPGCCAGDGCPRAGDGECSCGGCGGCSCPGEEEGEIDPGADGGEEADAGVPPLVHHSVRLVWEAAAGGGLWQPLASAEVEDGTRALTLSGRVTLRLPAPPAAVRVGEVEAALPTVRCRIAGGAYDAPPRLTAVILNGVRARQEVPAGVLSWPVAPGADLDGDPPEPGATIRVDATFERTEGPAGEVRWEITRLATGVADGPEVMVLGWQAPTAGEPGEPGRLDVEAVALGLGTGRPGRILDLPELLPAGERLTLWSAEQDPLEPADGDAEPPPDPPHHLRSWRRRSELDASRRADAHFVVEPRPEDAAAGVPLAAVRFGDGERGRALPEGAPAWTAYRVTLGRAGELAAGAALELADGPRNRALLADFEAAAARIAAVAAPLPSWNGSDGETLDDAFLRALEAAESSERAVTLADFERLALATPGVHLARAEARAELHPDFPCYRAPGVVTVLVLPFLPAERPMPGPGLLAAVAGRLGRRRVLGTRVEVAPPVYVEVRVRARVQACPGVDPAALAARLRERLDRFLHPLAGGPEGGGWPFGRAVYGSEVYQVLDETAGADHVLALELIGADGEPRCDNLCLPPAGLPAAGGHEIEVEGGASPC